MLRGLPEELVLNVLGYLTPSELAVCELVHSEWRRIALTDSLWRHLFRLAYPVAALRYGQQSAEEGPKRPRVVHKELYRERAEREQREAEELQRRKTTLEEPTSGHRDEASLYDTLYAAEPRPSVKAQVLLNQYNTDAHEGRFEDALENSKLAIHYFERLIADADSEGEDWDWRMYLEWYLGLIEAQSSKGFALRQLGYLSLAVEYYRKAIRTHDEFEATHFVTAPASVVSRAKMHLVTCTKNCGVAYMMLDKPELALPMIDRAVELQQSLWDANAFARFRLETQYLHLLACYTNRFRTLVALGDWPRAAADFAHLHGVVESNRREQKERTEQQDKACEEVATNVWGGLCSQVTLLADEQPDHYARLLGAIDQLFPHASAAARDIANDS